MWKFFSRGVREAAERNLNLTRAETVRVQKEKPKPPVIICQLLPVCDANGRWKHCGSREDNYNRKKDENSSAHWSKQSWYGAFSCSGALALGWVLSQPCLWRKWCGFHDRRKGPCKKKLRLLDLVSSVAWTQPVIPGAVAAVNYLRDASEGPQFGPKTAEEALDEAAEEFRAAHNSILAEIENKRAVDLMNRNKSREALELFLSASHRGYAPAAYNMAQCFELGVGIKQSFYEAAKWYQKAAELGHLTAMYNLGVFYVHGWGGLTPDTEKARQLFQEAARKGQPDAQAALGMNETQNVPSNSCETDQVENKSVVSPVIEDLSGNLSEISTNVDEVFNLASSFESSINLDPITSQLTVELYKIASDMGHAEAKIRAKVLSALEIFGVPKELEQEDNPVISTNEIAILNC